MGVRWNTAHCFPTLTPDSSHWMTLKPQHYSPISVTSVPLLILIVICHYFQDYDTTCSSCAHDQHHFFPWNYNRIKIWFCMLDSSVNSEFPPSCHHRDRMTMRSHVPTSIFSKSSLDNFHSWWEAPQLCTRTSCQFPSKCIFEALIRPCLTMNVSKQIWVASLPYNDPFVRAIIYTSYWISYTGPTVQRFFPYRIFCSDLSNWNLIYPWTMSFCPTRQQSRSYFRLDQEMDKQPCWVYFMIIWLHYFSSYPLNQFVSRFSFKVLATDRWLASVSQPRSYWAIQYVFHA